MPALLNDLVPLLLEGSESFVHFVPDEEISNEIIDNLQPLDVLSFGSVLNGTVPDGPLLLYIQHSGTLLGGLDELVQLLDIQWVCLDLVQIVHIPEF